MLFLDKWWKLTDICHDINYQDFLEFGVNQHLYLKLFNDLYRIICSKFNMKDQFSVCIKYPLIEIVRLLYEFQDVLPHSVIIRMWWQKNCINGIIIVKLNILRCYLNKALDTRAGQQYRQCVGYV
jgi:hypothetical protein